MLLLEALWVRSSSGQTAGVGGFMCFLCGSYGRSSVDIRMSDPLGKSCRLTSHTLAALAASVQRVPPAEPEKQTQVMS